MPKRLKFVIEQWVLFMVRRQTWRFEIFESARHFRIESGRPIRISKLRRSIVLSSYAKIAVRFSWDTDRQVATAGMEADLKTFWCGQLRIEYCELVKLSYESQQSCFFETHQNCKYNTYRLLLVITDFYWMV